ncbi:ATP-dependent Clp protease adaptor protein ClpS [Leptospira yanagawae serovar Saopaulo str. Sao Paulo = ATCC 700523]|uniref:ATP-dependent Clp protease adapter protein ClpS n=3 Tax=Leptospira TaxID=171 RepID=A0A4Z1A4G8_9LEPT|nr:MULTISPECIES: ATP-dependent Clp protease adapter ClpS [Leptospira]EOQ88132.1 ATP-dependent Clp protease adaptor protein ClpS [Leptospira yanagawae serovar Saopaulo str. Sao Paulo = ATCC 700523]TGL18667.1 ATP-dependent Clp protease adapter ClpS [Leptospira yanagawae]TGL69027.1 ATP-dependent Clp protease adapter ClpS [Leptospira jelokensis]TGL99374.1 ATP-dependent Clp protease adapter ClpS [Leptospira jelokensis]
MSETKRKSYTDFNVELLEKEKQKKQVKKPNRYQVILINDDYTPQEFVVYVLAIVFRKSMEESRQIMWKAHTEGSAVCGVYSLDIARTKVQDVHRLADEAGHPLQCQLAKEE